MVSATFTHILLSYGEIFLKGKNKGSFEQKLLSNIRKQCGFGQGRLDFERAGSRFLLPYFEEHEKLQRVFGLSNYALAVRVEKEIEQIKQVALKFMSEKKGTYRVMAKRADKRFALTSPEINVAVGSFLGEQLGELEFSLKGAEHVLHVEINEKGAFVFLEVVSCFGGLPVGTGGKVGALLDGSEQSLLACLLMMKRGVVPILFSSGLVADKDLKLLRSYSPKNLSVVQFADEKELIAKMSAKRLSVLVVGQQFSTFEEFSFEKRGDLLVFRPLIAFSSAEVEGKFCNFSQAIGKE